MHYLLVVLLLLWSVPVLGCDICGSNTASSVVDFNSAQPKSFIQHTFFVKKIDFQDPGNDLDHSIMWGQLYTGAYSLKSKAEFRATLPVIFLNNRYKSATAQKNWGLGDAMLQVNTKIIDALPFGDKKWRHTLIGTGGIELPTGSYVLTEDPLLTNVAFGSRSLDFLLGAQYRMSKFKGAFSTGIFAKLNTMNRNQLQYGHQYSWFAQGTYKFLDKKTEWQASLGSRFEHNNRNILNNIYQSKSGGDILQVMTGIHGGKKQWSWGISYQQPVWQKNGKDAFLHGSTLITTLQYQFKIKKQ